MNRLSLLVVGLLCLSVVVLAGEVITNDTGEDTTSLRVMFSTPVLITAFGDILTSVDPQMLSFEFVFSGGTVEPWGSHWFNYAPATASVIETEWLNQPSGSRTAVAADVTVVDHWRTDVFELFLPEGVGRESVGTITRMISVEQIPFMVEYEVELPVEAINVVWTNEQSSVEETPEIVESATARFVYRSNKTDPEVSVRFKIGDQEYAWTDPDISFPLHNLTEIALNAALFSPDEEVAAAAWSAVNGDPADAVTFPIDDPSASAATLVSDWPNVLTLSCEAAMGDGSTRSETVEALIYFRDGTPFEIRSVASSFDHPIAPNMLEEILDQEFELLRDIGANTITTGITWYFGPPDENGNWTIHPIWQSKTAWPHDPRGNTALDEDFEVFVTRAHNEGFQVQVQLRTQPYADDPVNIYWGRNTAVFDPRTTDGFLYGNGDGFESMLLYYLESFVRLGVELVYLGAEQGGVERLGGAVTRDFYDSIIEQYRDGGFKGGISYAIGFDMRYGYYPELFDAISSGIPLGSMDAVAATYYPLLSEDADASTLQMQDYVRAHIQEHFQELSRIYNKPTIVEDCMCFAYEDCAVNPIGEGDRPRQTECSRRYFNAILREFSAANISSTSPWVQGMTMAIYKIMEDRYAKDFYRDGIVAYPWLNESAGRVDIQLTIKTFFSDNPLVSIDGSETEIRPMELVSAATATLSIDDFSRTDLQPASGRWFITGAGCASSETDPCNMQVVGLTAGDRYLRVEGVSEKYWCASFEFDEPVDASLFDGIEIVLWADSNPKLEVSLSSRNAAENLASFAFPELRSGLAAVRTSYRIPFESFLPYSPMTGSGIPDNYLKAVHDISFCVDSGDRALNIDDLAWFYTLPD